MDIDLIKKIIALLERHPEVQLLMLFGSQAREEAKEGSDWDFAYIAEQNFDNTFLYMDLIDLLRTEKIDLVNLARASGLLRFRVAKDGKVVYEKTDGEFEKFWIQAVNFWCDAGPIIRAEYEALLRRIA